jgi:uncharacterized protein (TIRG00374 family)
VRFLWKFLLLATGLALFHWYLSRIGLDTVWRTVSSLGAAAPLVLLPYFVVYNIDCLAWMKTLPIGARRIPFLSLLRIRWCGESVNNFVPSAYVGGEATKVLLLRAQGISAIESAGSAVVSKTAQTVAQLVYILLASVLFLMLKQSDTSVLTGLLVTVTTGALGLCALFWIQSRGAFRLFIALSEKLRIKSRARDTKKAKLLEIDDTIQAFYRKHPTRFYQSTGLYFFGWLLDSVEIYLVAHLLQMPISWPQAIIVEAFTGVAKALGMWLPGSLGVQESGIVLMGRLTGLPDVFAAAYAVIRRARELLFAGAGLLLLYLAPTSPKPANQSIVI